MKSPCKGHIGVFKLRNHGKFNKLGMYGNFARSIIGHSKDHMVLQFSFGSKGSENILVTGREHLRVESGVVDEFYSIVDQLHI
jgi:hypothetical protein